MEELDIRPQYRHTKAGTFMFNLCAKWTKFLVKHRWLYYLLACTWGIIMTFVGVFVTICLGIARIFSKKIKFEKYLWIYDVKVGPDYWGGFETGLMFVRDQKSWDAYINPHEFGHTFQSCLLGPLMPFIVSLPSAARYWYQTIREAKGKDNKEYDAIWFEDSATQCGEYVANYLNRQKLSK